MKLKIPPLVVVLIFALTMWIFQATISIGHFHFLGRKLIAIVFFIFAVIALGMAVWHFKKSHTTVDPMHPGKASTLVVGGVYRYTRNPMYLGFLMIILSWVVYLGFLGNILLTPLFIWYINVFQIYPEEQALREKFRDSFEEYCARVRRWI